MKPGTRYGIGKNYKAFHINLQWVNLCKWSMLATSFFITPKWNQSEITVCTHTHIISTLIFFTETSGLLLSSIHIHNVRETLSLILLKPDCRSKRRGIAGSATSPISALQNNPEAGRPSYIFYYLFIKKVSKSIQHQITGLLFSSMKDGTHWPS